jgi:hypothetical protein
MLANHGTANLGLLQSDAIDLMMTFSRQASVHALALLVVGLELGSAAAAKDTLCPREHAL